MPRGERRVVGQRDERLRQRIADGRARPADEGLESRRAPVGERDGDESHEQHAPAPVDPAENHGDDDPEQPEASGIRQAFEDRVQPTRAMVDDPTLEVAIGGDQAGTICFVCSIKARRSNGFPTNPCAPRSAASRPASSWPLNMTTGIDPTPWRSWT